MPDLGCISDADLRAFVLGKLPERICQGVWRPLETCATCETAVEQLDNLADPLVRGLQQARRGEATDAKGLSENGRQLATALANGEVLIWGAQR